MKKKKYFLSNISFIFIVLLLVSYFVFPSLYVSVSQKLFTALYARTAHLSWEGSSMQLPIAQSEIGNDSIPLFVLARPPQTPYDFLITTALSEDIQEKKIGRYVYDDALVPVGFVEKKYPAVYVVTLFSALKSKEQFAVGDYVSSGIGEGGGSFSVQVPADIAVDVGMPIVHQATGAVVSTVVAVQPLPEKNIQQVIGVLHKSPLEMAVLYVERDAEREPATAEMLEEVIQSIRDTAVETNDQYDDTEESVDNAEEIADIPSP